MSRIVFLTPPISLKARYGSWAHAGNAMPSLGILSLTAVCRQAGFDTWVVEAAARDLDQDQVVNKIKAIEPRYLGLSATTFSINAAAHCAKLAKQITRSITTIVGGPHLTSVPRETMERFADFDVGVIGEGEATIVELVKALENGGNLEEVNGIIFRVKNSEKAGENTPLHHSAPRALIEDLDVLPFPAHDLLEGFPHAFHPPPFKTTQFPAASIVTSRGCPNRCIFCDRSVFGNHCRAFSSHYIIAWIRELVHRYGIKELLIEDDTFVLFKSRLVEICEGLLRERLGISWSCLGRVDMVTPELLKLMRKAGCWEIGYGIESGAQHILDFEKKKIDLAQVEQAVKWTMEAGILAKGFFMMGHPHETEESMRTTVAFARKISLSDISVMMLTPFPGSELYSTANQYGVFNNDWSRMNLLQPVFIPKGLSEEKLNYYTRRMLKEFYLRPRIIREYFLRMVKHPRTIVKILKGFYAFLTTVFPLRRHRSGE